MGPGMAGTGVRAWLLLVALPAIVTLGGGSMTVTLAADVKQDGKQFADVSKYFPGVAEDRTRVTWAHRVNTRQALLAALNDSKTMMLEADVIFGKVNKSGDDMPVMAHDPSDEIDLSLSEFLKIVNDTLKKDPTVKKGVKLDFKSEQAFNMSRDVIQEARKAMENSYPLWLNADILAGPVAGEKGNVKPEVFLNESSVLFPSAGLSVGWTTNVPSGDTTSCYSTEHLKKMLEYLQQYNLHNSDNVTLAVRAVYAGRCYAMLADWLDENLKKATLTLWTGDNDKPSPEDLRKLIAKVSRKRIYVDLPDPLREQVLNTTTPDSSSSRIGSIVPLILFPFTLALWRLQ